MEAFARRVVKSVVKAVLGTVPSQPCDWVWRRWKERTHWSVFVWNEKKDCGNVIETSWHFSATKAFNFCYFCKVIALKSTVALFPNSLCAYRSRTLCWLTAAVTIICSASTRISGSSTQKRCSIERPEAPICWRFSRKTARSQRDLARTRSPTQVGNTFNSALNSSWIFASCHSGNSLFFLKRVRHITHQILLWCRGGLLTGGELRD